MSIPPWKKAILERKRNLEEEEKKKQAEKEAYLASLPPWKRAMVLKKMEQEKTKYISPKLQVETPQSDTPVDKWQQAVMKLKQVNKMPPDQPRPVNTAKVLDSIPKEKPVPSWKKALQERKAVAAAKKKIEESKQEQVNAEKSHDIVSPVRKGLEDRHSLAQVMQIFEHTSKDPDKEKHIQDEKDIPQLAQQQQQQHTSEETPYGPEPTPNSLSIDTSSPPSSPASQTPPDPIQSPKTTNSRSVAIHSVKMPSIFTQTQTESNVKPSTKKLSMQRMEILNEEDPKFLTMPQWKRDLMRRKQLTIQSSIQSESVSKPQDIATKPEDKSSSTNTTQIPKIEEQRETKNKPEIVNSSNKKDEDSPKLVKREGKSLKPPVFQVKSKWADITEDDPEFQNLPPWKRALIRRRKEDVTKRTAPPPESPTKKEETDSIPISTPWSPTHTQDDQIQKQEDTTTANKNIPKWMLDLNKKKTPPSTKPVEESLSNSVGSSGKVQALLSHFSGQAVVVRKPHNPSPEPEVEMTLIDEEDSEEDEPITPLKTSRSGSILKTPDLKTFGKVNISWYKLINNNLFYLFRDT